MQLLGRGRGEWIGRALDLLPASAMLRCVLCALLLVGGAHARPHIRINTKHLRRPKSCEGCTGLPGPCITSMFKKVSTTLTTPNGFLFCSEYLHRNADAHHCPKGYRDCDPVAPRVAPGMADTQASAALISPVLANLERAKSSIALASRRKGGKAMMSLADRLAKILEEAKMIEAAGGGNSR